MEEFRFTKGRIADLPAPTERPRVFYKDAEYKKLVLQVTQSGAKSFYFRYWDRQTDYTTKICLGKFPDLLPDEARKQAIALSRDLAKGIDPAAKRRAQRAEMTFGEAYRRCIHQPRRKRERRPATLQNYELLYRIHLAPRFGKKRLRSLLRSDVLELHEQLGERNGPYVANRAVRLVACVFNDAIARGWEGQNPCVGIEYYPEMSRTRFLEEEELAAFIRTCERETQHGKRSLIADFLLLVLLTGVRRKNACSVRWDQLDLERQTWEIPGDQWKNGQPHRVYLCNYLVQLLRARYVLRDESEYVFPSRNKLSHLTEPKKGLAAIVKRAGINPKGVNVHCLRHTFLTYADDCGMPSAVRKRLAGHALKKDAIDGYTHALERRVRESYEKVARHMLGIARQQDVAKHRVNNVAA